MAAASDRKRRYAALADTLIQSVQRGEYPVGGHLPTEAELCTVFGVSRSTVRQALRVLESSGLIERRQGSGTKVVASHAPVRYVLSLASEADILRYASESLAPQRDRRTRTLAG
jgi:GntR family transcriptional regulator